MKKKTQKKVLNSLISIVGILALALVGFSLTALVWRFIYENPVRNLLIGLGVLGVLLLLGKTSYKKIKKKVVDIFT